MPLKSVADILFTIVVILTTFTLATQSSRAYSNLITPIYMESMCTVPTLWLPLLMYWLGFLLL